MPTILGRLTGVSFQTELLVMTFLGLVNSVRYWRSFSDWTRMVEKTRDINLKSKYSDVVKTVLCWVIIARIIIAHLYTVTYLANFYPILTRCRPNVLLPWMTVSGFQNFILEFTVIVVGLLLYLENEFSIGWLAALVVCKLAFLVPAVYYWRKVKTFFVDLVEMQRRKLTRGYLTSNVELEFRRSPDAGERLRFRSTFAEGFAYRQQRFTSLVNLSDVPLNSSFESDGERFNSKTSRSLESLGSQESRGAVRSQEDSRLLIAEDPSLTPVEKSLRILGMNRDDINETRVRLGMNVLPTGSRIEDTEEIVSTVEPKDNVDPVDGRSARREKTGASTATTTMSMNNVATGTSLTNVNPKDEAHSTSKRSKPPAGNPSPGCTCRKAEKRSVVEDADDPGKNRNRPSDESFRQGRNGAYDEDGGDSSKSSDSAEEKPSEKSLANESKVVGVEPVKRSLGYLEDPKSTNAELFRADHLDQDALESTDSCMNVSSSHNVQPERSLLRIVGNRSEVYTQTDFVNASGIPRSNEHPANADFLPGAAKTSTSTQTDVSFSWSESILRRTLDASIDRNENLLRSKPAKSSGRESFSRALLFADMAKLPKPKNRLETEEEREAREMRALRIYNRRTLFKYKREIESREQNSAFGSRVALQSLIYTAQPSKPREPKASTETIQGRSDRMPKRQARSRPQQRTSKLSAVNAGLDALEYAISSSFSSKKKNRTRRQDSITDSNENPAISSRKHLSKHNESTRISEGSQRSSPPMTRFEGPRKGRDLGRTAGAENITMRKTTTEINPKNCFTDSAKLIDGPECHDKHGISSLKETLRNIDWSFNNQQESEVKDAPSQNDLSSRGDAVLYDIIDDTDVISLLQSAFASNPGNTERGFYLGPGSTELYSVTNYLEDVVGEIMKTARLRPNPDAFALEPTTEVDYGESYLQEFKATRLSALEGDDEAADSESGASDDTKIDDIHPAEPAEFDAPKPTEMCWNSYSGEGFVPRSHRRSSSSHNPPARKGIADLLGEKEISSLEFWARELRNLASDDRRDDPEFTKHFRHLIEIPGYCVIKTFVDFCRDFVTVSRSTMTSRWFNGADLASTPSSLRSEEIISGGLNNVSRGSLVNGEPVEAQDTTSAEVIDPEVADCLRELIDRLAENAESDDRRNIAVIGIHDDRTTFPLREDQFYFGPPKNARLVIAASLSPKFQTQNHQFIRNDETEAYHLANLQSPRTNSSSAISGPEVRDDGAGTASSLRTSAVTGDAFVIAKGLPSIALTADSYDSFYSSGAADSSEHSDNVISIGGESTFEDFPEDPPNATAASLSQPRYNADLSNSGN